jgi:hypothetical protein
MKRPVPGLATLGVLLLSAGLLAQSNQPGNEEFAWHAELVALDESMRIVTVKAPTVGEQTAADFGPLKGGERILLRWSGYDKFADSISRVVRPADVKANDRFTFPADFVSYDAARRYVTFKVQVPANHLANVKALKPGEWVTATSPHGSLSKTTPVVAIRPFVISSTQAG